MQLANGMSHMYNIQKWKSFFGKMRIPEYKNKQVLGIVTGNSSEDMVTSHLLQSKIFNHTKTQNIQLS